MDIKDDKQLEQELKMAVRRHNAPRPDVGKAWERFDALHNTKIPQRNHHRPIALIAALASIIVCVSLYFTYFAQPSVTPDEETLIFAHKPSLDGIRLTTADGTDIALEDSVMEEELHKYGLSLLADGIGVEATEEEVPAPKMMTLTVPRGKDYHVTLPDGSEVWLNSDSKLFFPESFSAEGERQVELIGEAYFDVAHDEEHPFRVVTPQFSTLVLGTSFDVRSYTHETPSVVLLNGSVALEQPSGERNIMKPGQLARLQEDGSFSISTVDTYSFVQWREGLFYFDNAELQDIMIELGRWYNVDVAFSNTSLQNVPLHFVASREDSLETALRNLNTLNLCEATLLDGKIVLK